MMTNGEKGGIKMANRETKKLIKETLYQVAKGIETGSMGKRPRVAVTLLGSEHGPQEILQGAEEAQRRNPNLEILCIGPEMPTDLEIYVVHDEAEQHEKMDALLAQREIDACVTMHYSFPIGVSTVGRVITPARGREMIIATTTGTSATNRIEAMVANAIYGIAVAKATGLAQPGVGILNVEGARTVERILRKLEANGYPINWAESARVDGGVVMRGNDLLQGIADVMVMDSLTGNIVMKLFSSYTTGGSYESVGYGYGPGVGPDFDRIVCILSRASGAPVVAKALEYAGELAEGDLFNIFREEWKRAEMAGLREEFAALVRKDEDKKDEGKLEMPAQKVVTEEIPGIEILDLEEAAKEVWRGGIYAETGMGCAGPVIMVATEDKDKAEQILKDAGYLL